LVDEYRHNTIIDLDLHVPDDIAEPPDEITDQLLSIAGESLSNVVRHSHASRANIVLDAPAEGGWTVIIEDNGVGFDPTAVVDPSHHGLVNTRGRAAQVGGTVAIESRPGTGTRVTVHVPHRST
jgi:signal transduction histidine kinase